jgi:hypothetical protein
VPATTNGEDNRQLLLPLPLLLLLPPEEDASVKSPDTSIAETLVSPPLSPSDPPNRLRFTSSLLSFEV